MAVSDQLVRIIIKAIDEAGPVFDEAAGKMQAAGQAMTKVGAVMTASVTAPILAAGAAGVKMATDLDEAMRNVQSVGGQTEEELAALSDTFVQMSMDASVTRDSAQNLAEAFYDIQGSGFEGAEGMQVLEAATKAASAGLTETSIAAEGITAVLNSYGMSAEEAAHVSDLMFTTVDRGVGSFEQLTSSMSNVVGTANSAGISFEEVSAAIATMSKQGQSFSEASVNLNRVILAFIKPTEDMKNAIESLGYASGQAMLDELGLAGAMRALEEAGYTSSESMTKLFGSVNALAGANALTGTGAKMFAEDLEAMGNASGATSAAFETQMKSFAATMDVFRNTLNGLLIELGQVVIPVLTLALKVITPFIAALAKAPPFIKVLIVAFALLAAAIGPVLLIAGQLVIAVTALGGVALPAAVSFAGLAGSLTGTAVALWAVMAPILPIIALIGLLIAAIVILVVHFDKVKAGADMVVQGWKLLFKELRNMAVHDPSKTLLQNMGENLRAAVDAWNMLPQVFGLLAKNIMKSLTDNINKGTKDFFAAVKRMAEGAKRIINKAFGIHSPSKFAADTAQNLVDSFQGTFDKLGGFGMDGETATQGATPASAGMVPALAGVSGGGGVHIENLNVPPGTTKEQIDYIMSQIARRMGRYNVSDRRGGTGSGYN